MRKLTVLALISILCINCKEEAQPAEDCKEKPSSTTCNTIYIPVCGCNNKTYANNCEANAHGIRIVSEGECPSK